MTLSGSRKLKFKAVSEFIAQLPFIIKGNTVQNIKDTENENIELAKQINTSRVFEPTISDPLDDVMEILDMPEPEHKKTFPYVEPTVELSTRWNRKLWKKNQRWLPDLMTKINKVNDVATEQKKQKEIEDVIVSVITDPIPNNNFWWEDEIFDFNYNQPTIDSSKLFYNDIKKETTNILKDIDINALSENILRNLRPVDNREIQELMDDFIPIDDRTTRKRRWW